MRLERINDRQVRCVVTNQDLAQRSISVESLKYGSKEASELFREVVTAASAQYGFNEEQLPVMIEAVPINKNELLIILSAVEDAEEMDPHFAHFADLENNGAQPTAPMQQSQGSSILTDNVPVLKVGIMDFNSIDDVILFSKNAAPVFFGESLLYRDSKAGVFHMVLIRPADMPNADFLKILNSVSEFGEPVMESALLYAYLREHETPLMDHALEKLSNAAY